MDSISNAAHANSTSSAPAGGSQSVGGPTSGASSASGGAATSAPAGPTGPDDPALKSFYSQQIQWSACTKPGSEYIQPADLGGLQCGNLKVPLDYTHPAADSVEIAVVREPAADKTKRVGSLLTNPGGPGGSGLEFVEGSKKDFATLHQSFDIIGFDPRGVGQSQPIRCLSDKARDALSEVVTPKDPAARKAKEDKDGKDYAAACEANSGKMLPFIGTRNVARDMDVLRGVLGDKKLNYLGISYGTYLGSLYAEQFPQTVGHMILDGAVDPGADVLEADAQQQIGFEKSFERFAADCVTNHPAECPLGTDPKAAAVKAGKFLDGLDDDPLPAQDPSGRTKVNSGIAWNGVLLYLYGDEGTSWQYLRQVLTYAMTDGDGTALLLSSDEFDGRDKSGHYASLDDDLHAVRCADVVTPKPTDAQVTKVYNELKQQAPILNTQTTKDDLSRPDCQDWPFQTTETPHVIKATGAAPILVVGTTDDPATPYASAVALAKGFDKATLLTRVGEGHGAFGKGNACIDKAMTAYLVSGTLPPDGTKCTA